MKTWWVEVQGEAFHVNATEAHTAVYRVLTQGGEKTRWSLTPGAVLVIRVAEQAFIKDLGNYRPRPALKEVAA